ncbi:hypothetical protein L211DRAFT_849540 [Terfezia boudieri ATCC MYA-4762]|uniref:EKC/KEOPS complex subunit BUD32 n=1 Tax=Terfezia boudieri ATCC MYA-4762 TaxID=1051890 RepID=A0A3N4LLA3_9PEZI|nr:hypothetical protein L211DRAFT_849540 [Terfezia boudieri ATCC MYA-4762]
MSITSSNGKYSIKISNQVIEGLVIKIILAKCEEPHWVSSTQAQDYTSGEKALPLRSPHTTTNTALSHSATTTIQPPQGLQATPHVLMSVMDQTPPPTIPATPLQRPPLPLAVTPAALSEALAGSLGSLKIGPIASSDFASPDAGDDELPDGIANEFLRRRGSGSFYTMLLLESMWHTCLPPVHTWVFPIITDLVTTVNKINGYQHNITKLGREFTRLLQKVLECHEANKEKALAHEEKARLVNDEQLKAKKKKIEKKDKRIEEQNRQMMGKDKRIEEQNREIMGKDKRIEEKDKRIEEQNRQIMEKDRQIVEKDKLIAEAGAAKDKAVKDAHEAQVELIQCRDKCETLRNALIRTKRKRDEALRWRLDHWADTSIIANTVGGSVSHSASWYQHPPVKKPHPQLDPAYALTPQRARALTAKIERVLAEGGVKESDYYDALEDVFKTYLILPEVTIFRTTNTRFLADQAPDIALCDKRTTKPHSTMLYGVIEIKAPRVSITAPDKLGQVKDYLLRMALAQPGRLICWAFLINVTDNVLIELRRSEDWGGTEQVNIWEYAPMNWVDMFHYIRQVSHRTECRPPTMPFATCLGNIERLLGYSAKWNIGQFATPKYLELGKRLKSIVVKVSSGGTIECHSQELRVLRHLRATKFPPKSVANLVWDPADEVAPGSIFYTESRDSTTHVQFGISPAGRPFTMSAFDTGKQFRKAISSLIDGLKWLHNSARVIHRDIRLANIILNDNLPVIIDFDCAFILPDNPGDLATSELTTYGGGLICVPHEVLRRAIENMENGNEGRVQHIEYEPQFRDDLCSFILFVIALLFPAQFRKFPLGRISTGGGLQQLRQLQRLQTDLAKCPIWGSLWTAAVQGQYETLKDISYIARWPEDQHTEDEALFLFYCELKTRVRNLRDRMTSHSEARVDLMM